MTRKEVEIQTALGTLSYRKWMELYGIKYEDDSDKWFFPILLKYADKLPRIVSIVPIDDRVYYTIFDIVIRHIHKYRYYGKAGNNKMWPEESKHWTEKRVAEEVIKNVYKDVITTFDHPELEIEYDD